MGSQGSQAVVSSVLTSGVRPDSMERDSRAEAAGDLESDLGTPQSLLGGSNGSSTRVLDLVPTGLDRWHRYGGVSFCGIPVAQFWAEFCLWESLINERSYRGIVELGTLDGGFSLYLATQAAHRGMFFRTYDVRKPAWDVPGFVQIDIYASADEIGKHLRRHDPVIVFCDGGNKPRELKTFSRYVTPESLLVTHDWGTEVLRKDIPDNVEMVHEEWCVELGSASRCFRVRA